MDIIRTTHPETMDATRTVHVKAFVYLRNGLFQATPEFILERLHSDQFSDEELLVSITMSVMENWDRTDYKPDIRKVVISYPF